MGTTFVQELSMMLYATSSFSLKHPKDLANFLNTDLLDTACVPLLHVKHITIDISLGSFNKTTGRGRPWWSTKFNEVLKRHYIRAIDNLVVMKIVPWKPGAKLVLRVDYKWRASGEKFAKILYPVVYDLKDRGWDVEIQGSYSLGNNITPTARDFNYSVPREVWQKKAGSNSAFVR